MTDHRRHKGGHGWRIIVLKLIALSFTLLTLTFSCGRTTDVTWQCDTTPCPDPSALIEAHRAAWSSHEFGCAENWPPIPFDYDRQSAYLEIVFVEPSNAKGVGRHYGERRRIEVEIGDHWRSTLWHELNLGVMWFWADAVEPDKVSWYVCEGLDYESQRG